MEDRPKREKWTKKMEGVYGDLETLIEDVKDGLWKSDIERSIGIFKKELAQAKTKAKIEVLEEVLEDLDNKFKQLAEMGSKPSKENPRDITRDLFAKFFILEKLDNLKKKKSENDLE